MARECQVSKKRGKVGNNVSHSKRRTKMKQEVNLQWKRFFIPEQNRWVKLRVSAAIIRTISKRGIIPTLKKYGMLKKVLG